MVEYITVFIVVLLLGLGHVILCQLEFHGFTLWEFIRYYIRQELEEWHIETGRKPHVDEQEDFDQGD